MAENGQLFTVTEDAIVIEGIKTLIAFSKYHPIKKDTVLKGLYLAEDLLNEKGGVLYSSGTELDHQVITRLVKTQDLNPETTFQFKVQRSPELTRTLVNRIISDVVRLIRLRSSSKTYSFLFTGQEKQIVQYITEVFTGEDILYALYQQKMMTELVKIKEPAQYYNHALNVAIFSVALARSDNFKDWNWGKDNYLELVKAAILHNFGSVVKFEDILSKNEEFRKDEYLKALKETDTHTGEFSLGADAKETIHKVIEHFEDPSKLINDTEVSGLYANMILIADIFCNGIQGLFKARLSPRDSVDAMNVQAVEGKLHPKIVEALTQGLTFIDMFDFYREIKRLTRECPYGEYAWPYPMTGFKSPVVFVCKVHKKTCEHYEAGMKAITTYKETGGLAEGQYCRCQLTTPQLQRFYEDHYEEIKEEVVLKALGQSGKEPEEKPAEKKAEAPAKKAADQPEEKKEEAEPKSKGETPESPKEETQEQ